MSGNGNWRHWWVTAPPGALPGRSYPVMEVGAGEAMVGGNPARAIPRPACPGTEIPDPIKKSYPVMD